MTSQCGFTFFTNDKLFLKRRRFKRAKVHSHSGNSRVGINPGIKSPDIKPCQGQFDPGTGFGKIMKFWYRTVEPLMCHFDSDFG